MKNYILDYEHFVIEYALQEYIAHVGHEADEYSPLFLEWYRNIFVPQLLRDLKDEGLLTHYAFAEGMNEPVEIKN